jgi:hypothetical protein
MLRAWMPLSMRGALAGILQSACLAAMPILKRGLSGPKLVSAMAVNRLSLS